MMARAGQPALSVFAVVSDGVASSAAKSIPILERPHYEKQGAHGCKGLKPEDTP